jgi:histidine ammonia-lyase
MESEQTLDHDTTLEHALDIARANQKEAKRLLEEARAAHAAGGISAERVSQLESLLAVADEDLKRVIREQ